MKGLDVQDPETPAETSAQAPEAGAASVAEVAEAPEEAIRDRRRADFKAALPRPLGSLFDIRDSFC